MSKWHQWNKLAATLSTAQKTTVGDGHCMPFLDRGSWNSEILLFPLTAHWMLVYRYACTARQTKIIWLNTHLVLISSSHKPAATMQRVCLPAKLIVYVCLPVPISTQQFHFKSLLKHFLFVGNGVLNRLIVLLLFQSGRENVCVYLIAINNLLTKKKKK